VFGLLVSWKVGEENKETFNITGIVVITLFLLKTRDRMILNSISSSMRTQIR